MPKALDKCVRQMRRKGTKEASAWAICTKALQDAGKLRKKRSGRRKGRRR